MGDHVKAQGWKVTFPKIVLTVVTFLIFAWIVPFEPITSIVRSISFETLFISAWLLIVGLAFTIETLVVFANVTLKGSARFAGYLILSFGLIAFGFGFTTLFSAIDIVNGSPELRMIASFILVVATLMFFVTLAPEIFKRESFLKAIAG